MLFPRALINTDEPQKLKTLTHVSVSVHRTEVGARRLTRKAKGAAPRWSLENDNESRDGTELGSLGRRKPTPLRYFPQKNSHRSDSCLTFAPFLHPTVYKPTLPHPPIPSPNLKRDCPLPLSHRCRTPTRHLCVNSASPLPPPPPPPPPPSRRRRHERGVVGRGGGGPVARHEHVVVAGPEEEADRELAPARAGVRLPRLGAQALGPTDDVPG